MPTEKVVCVKCGHNNISDLPKGTSTYGMCVEPVRNHSFSGWPKPTIACGCHCIFSEPKHSVVGGEDKAELGNENKPSLS